MNAENTPKRVGPYRILELLGKGGIGEVFLAQRDGDERLCALKRVQTHMMDRGSALARLRREAHVTSLLDHPHIAKVYDAKEIEGTFCVAAEFIPGVEVRELIRAGRSSGVAPLPPAHALTIAMAVLEALDHAHAAKDERGEPVNLVHRDLSSRNVMVSFTGEIKVIDFGIVHARIDGVKTQTGMIVGTPPYLSPEQASGNAVDHRSDLYSVSTVLFEMLTGTRVTKGEYPMKILYSVVHDEAPRPSSIVPSLPPACDELLAKGLTKDREGRFQSAGEYLTRLRAIAAEAGASTPEQLGAFVRTLLPKEEAEAHRRLLTASQSVSADDLHAPTRAEVGLLEDTVLQPQRPPSKLPRLVVPFIGLFVMVVALGAVLNLGNRTAAEIERTPPPTRALKPPPPTPSVTAVPAPAPLPAKIQPTNERPQKKASKRKRRVRRPPPPRVLPKPEPVVEAPPAPKKGPFDAELRALAADTLSVPAATRALSRVSGPHARRAHTCIMTNRSTNVCRTWLERAFRAHPDQR